MNYDALCPEYYAEIGPFLNAFSFLSEPNLLSEVGLLFCCLFSRKEFFDLRENNKVRQASSPNAQMRGEKWI